MNIIQRFGVLAASIVSCVGGPHTVSAQGVDVSATIELRQPDSYHRTAIKTANNSNVIVMWLSPLQPGVVNQLAAAHPNAYKLVQKNKQFTPHLLVIPTGSTVEFPNLDPFYHNVFSLFNGKRFDLGLYEAGSTRTVHFDREGVSYIFCNIHPEMAAVVLSLSTPYYATVPAQGVAAIHNVPAGAYRLNVWTENGQPSSLSATSRIIHVAAEDVHLGSIQILAAADPIGRHKNKFGEDYPPDMDPTY